MLSTEQLLDIFCTFRVQIKHFLHEVRESRFSIVLCIVLFVKELVLIFLHFK